MKYFNILKKEDGFSIILAVIMMSSALVTSLATIYVYTINQSKHHARVREAYKLMNVMEQASKSSKSAWDSAYTACQTAANCGPDGYPTNTQVNLAMPLADAACVDTCRVQLGVPTNSDVAMCFPNTNNSTAPYCFRKGAGIIGKNSIDFRLVDPMERMEMSRFDKFVAKINSFFDRHGDKIKLQIENPSQIALITKPTLFGWVFAEKQALAEMRPNLGTMTEGGTVINGPIVTQAGEPEATGTPPHNSEPPKGINMGTKPACVAGQNVAGCMACGGASGRPCMTLGACPMTMPQCVPTEKNGAVNPIFFQSMTFNLPGQMN